MLKKIKISHLELFSFIILWLWIVSPVIEYIFKIGYKNLYMHYFICTIYFIGSIGIITYIIYLIKLIRQEKISIKRFVPEILLIVLLIISIVSSFLSEHPQMSFFGDTYRKEGLIVYTMYIGFILLSSIIKDSKYIKYLFMGMIVVCLIITITPLFGYNFTYDGFTNIFHNLNHYGYYLMINTMIALFMFINNDKLYQKIIYMLIYIFFLYLLIRNDTFGSYLAIFATLMFLFIYSLIKKYKRIQILSIILVFIVTSFLVSYYDIKIGEKQNLTHTKGLVLNNLYFLKKDIKDLTNKDGKIEEGTGSYRIVLWNGAWKYTLEHPIFGGGMECLQFYYMKESGQYYTKYNDRPHNILLQFSSFIGIPGAIIYIVFIMYVAITNLVMMKKNTLRIMIYCTAMCYFISSLFGNSMYYTSPYFTILLGLLIGFNRCNKKTNKIQS